MEKERPKYHYLRKRRAGTSAALRVVVIGYLLYLAWQIVRGAVSGSSTIPAPAAWLIGAVLAAAALAFGCYAWRRYQADLKAAELTPEELEKEG